VTLDFDADLRRLMKLKGITKKSAAVRPAVKEAGRELRSNSSEALAGASLPDYNRAFKHCVHRRALPQHDIIATSQEWREDRGRHSCGQPGARPSSSTK